VAAPAQVEESPPPPPARAPTPSPDATVSSSEFLYNLSVAKQQKRAEQGLRAQQPLRTLSAPPQDVTTWSQV
jgi:hypothetical protein